MTTAYESWRAGGARVSLPGIGHQIFVRTDGPADGAPVTLLHGFPTSSHDWAPVLPYLLQAGCRVTTFDFLGFGDSDKPHPYRYSLIEQADIVEAIWREAGIVATALVAHDYGVTVGQELLARNSERFTSTTWLNGGLYPDLHRPTKGQRLLHGRMGPVIARGFNEKRFAVSISEVFGREVSAPTIHEMWLALLLRDGVRVTPALLHYIDERKVHAERWIGALESYDGPKLFVWGPADPVSGGHVIPRLRERNPRAEVVVLDAPPAVGHYPQVEAPELVGPLLVRGIAAR